MGVDPRLPACKASTLSTRPGSPLTFDEDRNKNDEMTLVVIGMFDLDSFESVGPFFKNE